MDGSLESHGPPQFRSGLMVGKLLLAFVGASIAAVPSAAASMDKPNDDRCWQKGKRAWAKHYGPKHYSPYYNPGFSGARTHYGIPYGGPVAFSPYSPTRIAYARRCVAAGSRKPA